MTFERIEEMKRYYRSNSDEAQAIRELIEEVERVRSLRWYGMVHHIAKFLGLKTLTDVPGEVERLRAIAEAAQVYASAYFHCLENESESLEKLMRLVPPEKDLSP